MHGYLHAITSNVPNTYSAAALERTAAAQQAAETRRKLLSASREVSVDEASEDLLAIGGRLEQGSQRRSDQQGRSIRKDGDGGDLEQFVIEPISVWA